MKKKTIPTQQTKQQPQTKKDTKTDIQKFEKKHEKIENLCKYTPAIYSSPKGPDNL